MTHLRRTQGALAAGLSLLLVWGLAPALAGADNAPNACVSPNTGVNLNTLYDVDEAIVAPFCTRVDRDEPWRHVTRWVTAASGQASYPDGYTPSRPNAIEDFNLKFEGARYVVDVGTKREKTFVYGPEILRTRLIEVDGLPYSAWLPLFAALPKGNHTVDVYVRMSAEHWDGVGVNELENSLPAGETYFGQSGFVVGKSKG